jgi:hypothetical protein
MVNRRGFIKNTYGLVAAQFAIVACAIMIPWIFSGYMLWLRENQWIIFMAIGIMVGAESVILFSRLTAETKPFNYAIFGVFTFGLSLCGMVIASRYTPSDILFLVILQASLLGCLYIYALKAPDFTEFGAMMVSLVVGATMAIILLLMSNYPPGYSLISCSAMASWGLFVVIDVQYVMGSNNVHKLKED